MSGKEYTPAEAWQLIQDKHRQLAVQEFRAFMQTGLLQADETDQFPTYQLTDSGASSLFYDSSVRKFLKQNEVKAELTKFQDLIFKTLLDHPDEVQTYRALYRLINPEDKTDYKDHTYVELMRPHMSRLRERLDEADPHLLDRIQTVRGTGYRYTMHPNG